MSLSLRMNSFPPQEFHQVRVLATRNQNCRLNSLAQQLESLCVHACGCVCAYVCAWVLVYYSVVKLILLPGFSPGCQGGGCANPLSHSGDGSGAHRGKATNVPVSTRGESWPLILPHARRFRNIHHPPVPVSHMMYVSAVARLGHSADERTRWTNPSLWRVWLWSLPATPKDWDPGPRSQ